MNGELLKIIEAPYLDEHEITQIPTNQGHMIITVCANIIGIGPKTLYSRLARTKDAWMRDDILDKVQRSSGGGYRYEERLNEMCKGLAPRRDARTIKLGTWERRYL